MALIAIPNETRDRDKRTAMTPDNAGKLVRQDADVLVEAGLGTGCGFADDQYTGVGAGVTGKRLEMFAEADLILRIHKPKADEIARLKKGSIHIELSSTRSTKCRILSKSSGRVWSPRSVWK